MRRPGNPLALAVLALLFEHPMHPYEMSSTLKFRHKEDSIKINYGSLYAVVESLEKQGLIEAVERIREGRRPERTVYALTELGEQMLRQWLGELVARPSSQFTDFEAALSLLPAIPPELAQELLQQRLAALVADTEEYERTQAGNPAFPRVFAIEGEYRAALRTAELAFVRALINDIRSDALTGLPLWHAFHARKRSGQKVINAEELLAEFAPGLDLGAPDTEPNE